MGREVTSKPPITVVVPSRDRPEFLPIAVSAALDQEAVDVSVVVIDDCSEVPARTLPRLLDPRVRIITMSRSFGVAAARNAGLAVVDTAWVAFLDDDDVWAPTKLREQLEVLQLANADWAYCAAVMFDDRRGTAALIPAPPSEDVASRLLAANALPAGGSNVIVRTGLIRALGGFDESLSHLDDWDAWIRLAQRAPAATVDVPLVGYRLHAGNRALGEDAALHEIDKLAAKHDGVLKGSRADRGAIARGIAWRQRVEGRRSSAARIYLRSAIRDRSPSSLGRAIGAVLGEPVWPARPLSETSWPDWIPRPGP